MVKIMGKNKGGKGGKMRASHILVKKHSVLLGIMDKIDGGASFKDMAKQHSECPSKNKGGDLGFFARGAMVPEFEKSVLSMKVGDVSEPVKTQFGWHLIKRTG